MRLRTKFVGALLLLAPVVAWPCPPGGICSATSTTIWKGVDATGTKKAIAKYKPSTGSIVIKLKTTLPPGDGVPLSGDELICILGVNYISFVPFTVKPTRAIVVTGDVGPTGNVNITIFADPAYAVVPPLGPSMQSTSYNPATGESACYVLPPVWFASPWFGASIGLIDIPALNPLGVDLPPPGSPLVDVNVALLPPPAVIF